MHTQAVPDQRQIYYYFTANVCVFPPPPPVFTPKGMSCESVMGIFLHEWLEIL